MTDHTDSMEGVVDNETDDNDDDCICRVVFVLFSCLVGEDDERAVLMTASNTTRHSFDGCWFLQSGNAKELLVVVCFVGVVSNCAMELEYFHTVIPESSTSSAGPTRVMRDWRERLATGCRCFRGYGMALRGNPNYCEEQIRGRLSQ